MKYTEEMILHSDSGYCMPFEEPRGKDVELSLGYGEQVHPTTGEKFFHHGIDFKARYYILSAVASGIVKRPGTRHLPDSPLRRVRGDIRSSVECVRTIRTTGESRTNGGFER